MTTPALDVVALFPSFDDNTIGGVQASGRDAFNGILGAVGEAHAHAFSYQPGTSKARAVLQVLVGRKKPHVILVWHLHLLKLVPFIANAGSRVILFLHGIEAWRRHDPVMQFLLRNVGLFVSNSDHTWGRFLTCNPGFRDVPHKTVHLGTGTPLDGLTPIVSNSSAVLMVGRLSASEDYKGHRQVIDAWPSVTERVPGAELWIAGEGDLRPQLETLARERVRDGAVRFFGRLPDAEKEQLLRKCRCLAMPSRGEGFGLVYLEAMRMGRPCIVSDVDAGREVVNPPEAGLAVNAEDSSQIVEAITRLLTPGRDWDGFSDRARGRYEQQFTAAHFHRRLADAVLGS
jgi:phosphatidylinositol alpha-1,6-mannosyltransferase